MLSKQIATASLSFLLLIVWYLTYNLSCISIIIPITIGLILFKTKYEYANAKKQCLANCYFKQNSFLFKLLTKKVIIFILSIVSGTILSLILTLNIIVFNISDFIVLILDIIFIIYLYNNFNKNKSFNDNIKESIVKNSVSFVNSVILSILFLIINFYQTPPAYLQNDLLETIKLASSQVYSTCSYIDSITRLSNEIIAIKWWTMLNLTINLNNYYLKELMWIIYLLGNYLMIFAFSRLNLELLSLLKREFKNG